jgi:hypothetical protein
MGLFDRFKKKVRETENNVSFETLLEKAADEPAYRAEFYKRLLAEKFVVITKDRELPVGQYEAKEDTPVNISSFGDGRIPVFTSTGRIFDKGVIKQQVAFLELEAEALLKMLPGKTLILNPYSDYGMVLLPNDIEMLLDGTFFSDNIKPVEVKKHSTYKIGQPEKYPTEVARSLIELFSNRPNVYAAYLGWIQYSQTDEPPHYVFAIDSTGDWDSLIQEAGFTSKQILADEEIVDFVKINNNGGISDYFINETTPFYKK